jgi:hypothetical protein
MRLYLAGPMTGVPQYNLPAFHAAAGRLRSLGHNVSNPAENFDGRTDLEWTNYLAKGIRQVTRCEAVAVLPGWRKSRGARLEVVVAKALTLPILDAETLEAIVPQTVLEEATTLVHGDRAKDYGHPATVYATVGRIWGAMLGIDDLSAARVCLMLAAMKVGRHATRPKRDNLIDCAGYCETVQMCEDVEP